MSGDTILFENLNLRADLQQRLNRIRKQKSPEVIPEGVTNWLDDPSAINETKRVKDLACFDIVPFTRNPQGEPVVLLSLRNREGAFGGKWWMYGGSLGAYADVEESIAKTGQKECGVPVQPEALVGLYRTCAPDKIQSTLQPCYAGWVSYEVATKTMQADKDHKHPKFFTLGELLTIPEDEQHWYPMNVAELVLNNMP